MAAPRFKANQYTPSSYDSEKHPRLLISLFAEGGDICDFCDELNIGKRTFFLWIKLHEDLAEAYEIAKSKAERWLMRQGRLSLHAEHFQATVWSILIRNRCRITEHRTVPISFVGCKTSNEKLLKVEALLAEGELTPTEAKILTDMVKSAAEINEKTELAAQVEELVELTKGKK